MEAVSGRQSVVISETPSETFVVLYNLTESVKSITFQRTQQIATRRATMSNSRRRDSILRNCQF